MAAYLGVRNLCKTYYNDIWNAPRQRLQKPPPSPKPSTISKPPSRTSRILSKINRKVFAKKPSVETSGKSSKCLETDHAPNHEPAPIVSGFLSRNEVFAPATEKLPSQESVTITASSGSASSPAFTGRSSIRTACTTVTSDTIVTQATTVTSDTGSTIENAVTPVQYVSRMDFDTIEHIPNELFRRQLAECFNEYVEYDESQYEWLDAFTGGSNHIRIFEVKSGKRAGVYVVKIPGVGTPDRWTEADEYMLRAQFYTMRYISQHTKFPVPEVIQFHETFQNELMAPYIIMRYVSGVDAEDIWYDTNENGSYDRANADNPSPERMEKRLTLLRTLAKAMAELRSLKFKGIGMVDVGEIHKDGTPFVGPIYQDNINTTAQTVDTEDAIDEQKVYRDSYSMWSEKMEEQMGDDLARAKDLLGDESTTIRGIYFVLRTVLDLIAFDESRSGPETFVLRHDDLDFQNIVCDPETGAVISILDYDLCHTAPHCMGYASIPMWLQGDWFPSETSGRCKHNSEELWKYRRAYSDAMIEATGSEGDGKYTMNSCIVQAFHASLFGSSQGGSVSDFADKVLRRIPMLAFEDTEEFLLKLGSGCQDEQALLRSEVKKLLAC